VNEPCLYCDEPATMAMHVEVLADAGVTTRRATCDEHWERLLKNAIRQWVTNALPQLRPEAKA